MGQWIWPKCSPTAPVVTFRVELWVRRQGIRYLGW